MKKLIDVSRWQKEIDWDALKSSGIDGVLIKAGGSDNGIYEDPMYRRNVAEAERVGIEYGVYYYVGPKCITAEDGIADAKRFEKLLKSVDAKCAFPVYIDLESTCPPDKAGATDATIAFCEYMEQQGYFVGIYASDISGFKDRLDISRLDAYTKWVASYHCKPWYVKKYDVWQYSDKEHISGIATEVDMNECYKDFPSIIKDKGLNGFPKPESVTTEQFKSSEPEKKSVKITVEIDGSKYGGTITEIK